MATVIHLTDLNHPNLDHYLRLTEAQLRNRLEPEKGIFIAESDKVIALALDRGCQPISLLMDERHIEGKAKDIIARCGDVPVYTGPASLLEELTGFPLTRGVLCAMYRPKLPSLEELCQGARRIAIVDGLVDSTNVGAVARSAAAMHIDGILFAPTCCDPLCRRAVRVSMGTLFQVPWTKVDETPHQWPKETFQQLHNMGFKTVAMALTEDAIPVDNKTLMAEEKLAILLGAEGNGLPQDTINQCDYVSYIPMSHMVDSLNVAAASAVAFWQLKA